MYRPTRWLRALRGFAGKRPVVGEGCYVDAGAVVIGDVCLGKESSVWPCAVIRGDVQRISVGDRTSVQDNSCLHVTHTGPFTGKGWPLVIGSDTTIGHNVNLHGCTIGDRVIVGIGSTVLDGAVVHDDVVIAANSLVPPRAELASGYLYVGSPVKQARKLVQKELDFFAYTSANYVKLARQHAEDAQRE